MAPAIGLADAPMSLPSRRGTSPRRCFPRWASTLQVITSIPAGARLRSRPASRWEGYTRNMNATELIKLMNRSPFQPLEIHLNDGSIITVNEPFNIATERASPCFVVYTIHKMDVVAYRNVTKITTPAGVE